MPGPSGSAPCSRSFEQDVARAELGIRREDGTKVVSGHAFLLAVGTVDASRQSLTEVDKFGALATAASAPRSRRDTRGARHERRNHRHRPVHPGGHRPRRGVRRRVRGTLRAAPSAGGASGRRCPGHGRDRSGHRPGRPRAQAGMAHGRPVRADVPARGGRRAERLRPEDRPGRGSGPGGVRHLRHGRSRDAVPAGAAQRREGPPGGQPVPAAGRAAQHGGGARRDRPRHPGLQRVHRDRLRLGRPGRRRGAAPAARRRGGRGGVRMRRGPAVRHVRGDLHHRAGAGARLVRSRRPPAVRSTGGATDSCSARARRCS